MRDQKQLQSYNYDVICGRRLRSKRLKDLIGQKFSRRLWLVKSSEMVSKFQEIWDIRLLYGWWQTNIHETRHVGTVLGQKLTENTKYMEKA